MYWDEAFMLMQIGLLDPKLLPKKLKSESLKQLPVVGAGTAKQLLESKQNRYSRLLQAHDLMD
jgi:carboxymethylenebutenolidase